MGSAELYRRAPEAENLAFFERVREYLLRPQTRNQTTITLAGRPVFLGDTTHLGKSILWHDCLGY